MPAHRLLALGFLPAGLSLVSCQRGAPPVESAAESMAPATPPVPGCLEDVTPSTGIAFSYRNGDEAGLATMLESLGGGVALLDYDGDGLLNIFLTGGGSF
jgi:hypothetical protein